MVASAPILATKFYIPPPPPKIVIRTRLIERLNEGLAVTLISAPAGFGKTTLVSEWVNDLRLTNDDLRLDAKKDNKIVNLKSEHLHLAHNCPGGQCQGVQVSLIEWPLSLDEGIATRPALIYLVAFADGCTETWRRCRSPQAAQAQPPPEST
jgi:hypothetical protein